MKNYGYKVEIYYPNPKTTSYEFARQYNTGEDIYLGSIQLPNEEDFLAHIHEVRFVDPENLNEDFTKVTWWKAI